MLHVTKAVVRHDCVRSTYNNLEPYARKLHKSFFFSFLYNKTTTGVHITCLQTGMLSSLHNTIANFVMDDHRAACAPHSEAFQYTRSTYE